jgi:hypothetical protein
MFFVLSIAKPASQACQTVELLLALAYGLDAIEILRKSRRNNVETDWLLLSSMAMGTHTTMHSPLLTTLCSCSTPPLQQAFCLWTEGIVHLAGDDIHLRVKLLLLGGALQDGEHIQRSSVWSYRWRWM